MPTLSVHYSKCLGSLFPIPSLIVQQRFKTHVIETMAPIGNNTTGETDRISCVQDEIRMTLFVVEDRTGPKDRSASFSLASTVRVKTLFEHVACSHKYQQGTFVLTLQLRNEIKFVSAESKSSLERWIIIVIFVCDELGDPQRSPGENAGSCGIHL